MDITVGFVLPKGWRQGYIDDAGVGHIPLTQGKEALVDAHNFHWLSQWNWCAVRRADGRWYAVRSVWLGNGKQYTQPMHRLIMGITDPNIEVDHKDRVNTLDNREANLRIATDADNQHNRGAQKNNTSGFKGVRKSRSKWMTEIGSNGKQIYLGSFNIAVEAAAVYNFAAKRLHGAFAVLNDLSQVEVL